MKKTMHIKVTDAQGRRLSIAELTKKEFAFRTAGMQQEADEVLAIIEKEKKRNIVRAKKINETRSNEDRRVWSAQLRLENKVRAIKYLGGKCSHCGMLYPPAAMQFHHRDPKEKETTLGQALGQNKFDKLVVELDKCDLVCANCHAIHHADQEGMRTMDVYK